MTQLIESHRPFSCAVTCDHLPFAGLASSLTQHPYSTHSFYSRLQACSHASVICLAWSSSLASTLCLHLPQRCLPYSSPWRFLHFRDAQGNIWWASAWGFLLSHGPHVRHIWWKVTRAYILFYCLPAHENHCVSVPCLPVVCGYVLLGSGHGSSRGCFRENMFGNDGPVHWGRPMAWGQDWSNLRLGMILSLA